MKKSVIWIAAGAAGIGLGIPAYAAMSPQDHAPRNKPSTTVVSMPDDNGGDTVTTAATTPTVVAPTPSSVPNTTANTTANTVEDISGPCDEAEHANDPRCTGGGPAGTVDDSQDDSTHDSTDDNTVNTTANTVEDISGPCDEAEHANDPRCTGGATSSDDHSGRGGGGHGSDDSSGRHGSGG